MAEIHVGDIGTVFQVTVNDQNVIVDLSNEDNMYILFRKPDDSFKQVIPTLLTNGTDGKIKYVTQSGDLDQYGTWQIQARVVFGTEVYSTDIQRFKVLRNLN
jgi:hypothetical protein